MLQFLSTIIIDYFFLSRVSSIPGLPQTSYVLKNDLELVTLLPLPVKCWDDKHMVPP